MALVELVTTVFSIPKEANLFPIGPGLFILAVITSGLVAFGMQALLVDKSGCMRRLGYVVGSAWHATAGTWPRD